MGLLPFLIISFMVLLLLVMV